MAYTKASKHLKIFVWTFILSSHIILTFASYASYGENIPHKYGRRFKDWMEKNDKVYLSAKEHHERLITFTQNAQLIDEHNARNHSYSLELNYFADLSFEEFNAKYLLTAPQNCSATHKRRFPGYKSSHLPDHVDWRDKGVISGVKNQGSCGSCWAFSTTGAMEAHMAISYHVHTNLSEQQLIDCAQAFHNHGCSGGLPSQAFEYILYNPGLTTEARYPYIAKDSGRCTFQSRDAVAFVKDVFNITEYDEDMIQNIVALVGPVSIAYQVLSDFRFYKSGVYSSDKCQKDPDHVNHAVLIVGYGTTPEGTPYWIVKNSWGEAFGLKGYFNILRGQNECGLADCASYPMVLITP